MKRGLAGRGVNFGPVFNPVLSQIICQRARIFRDRACSRCSRASKLSRALLELYLTLDARRRRNL